MVGRLASRTILVSSRGTRLSTENRQLVVRREGEEDVATPIEEIGVLLIDDPACLVTHPVLVGIAEAGGVVVFCGRDHHPVSMALPLAGHHLVGERNRLQVAMPKETKARIWQAIVRAKIEGQARVLTRRTGSDAGLAYLAGRVRRGDEGNVEAQAAQRYWPELMGKGFRRDRDEEGVNAALNYAYAIVRASVARSVVAAGLLPSIGVFHRHRANAFCLVDDAMEPLRPLVDDFVLDTTSGLEMETLDRSTRESLLRILHASFSLAGWTLPFQGCVDRTVDSLASWILTGRPEAFATPEPLMDEGS